MDTHYIGKEPYFGLSRKRPLVPEGEVWVFQGIDGENSVVSGTDRGILPPAPPLLANQAMNIHKFRRKLDFKWSMKLFEDLESPLKIEANVTLFLHDPVQLMAFLQHDPANSTGMDIEKLQPVLVKALERALKDETRLKSISLALMGNYDAAMPLAISQLVPETDLSLYVQGVTEVKKLGLEVRLIIQAASIRPSYKKLVEDVVHDAHKQFLPLKQEIVAIVDGLEREKLQMGTRLDLAGQRRLLQTELYSSQAEHIEYLRPELYRITEEVAQRNKVTTQQPIPPALSIIVFHDVVYQVIEQLIQQYTVLQLSSLSSVLPPLDNDRAEQIRTFYLAAQVKGWRLLPVSPEKVKEEIKVNLGNDSRLLLVVPRAYPKHGVKAVVTDVRHRGGRLPQAEVNKVTGPVLQRTNYNLNTLIQSIVDKLSEDISSNSIP